LAINQSELYAALGAFMSKEIKDLEDNNPYNEKTVKEKQETLARNTSRVQIIIRPYFLLIIANGIMNYHTQISNYRQL
jgi:hypothetical protein